MAQNPSTQLTLLLGERSPLLILSATSAAISSGSIFPVDSHAEISLRSSLVSVRLKAGTSVELGLPPTILPTLQQEIDISKEKTHREDRSSSHRIPSRKQSSPYPLYNERQDDEPCNRDERSPSRISYHPQAVLEKLQGQRGKR